MGMAQRNPSRAVRRVVTWTATFLLIAAGLGALEVAARYVAPVPAAPLRYLEISKGFAGLNAFLADRKAVRLIYADYQLYAHAAVSTENLTITDYHSSRRTPASVARADADTIVWIFGGSTMQNFETTDELSIANTIAKVFLADGLKPRVENFGLGSFQSSLELVQFSRLLARVPKRERPAVAIFYDGFNDANHGYAFGAGAVQRDLSEKLATLVEHRYGIAAAYAASAWLAQYSTAWTALVHNRLQVYLFARYWPDPSEGNIARTVDVYLNNIATTRAVCQTYMVRCFFVLQPLVLTKVPLSAEERIAFNELPPSQITFIRAFYEQVRAKLGVERDFIDASQVLDGRTADDFYDLGHTGALTSPVIGEAVGRLILERYKPVALQRPAVSSSK